MALVLALAMLAAACGGGGDDSGGAVTPPATRAPPTPGGKVVYGLEAETTDGWCLPEAQLAISGIMVARSIYDTLTRPTADGTYEPWLAESVEPNDDFTEWTISTARRHQVPRRHRPHRRGGEEQPRRLPGTYPTRKPQLFIFTFQNIANTEVVDPKTVRGR